MFDLQEKVARLNTLTSQGNYAAAYDELYDEHIIKHENENPPIVGLAANREYGAVFLSKVKNYSAVVKSLYLVDNLSVVVWHYAFEHQDWGKRSFDQVSVQRWKNGKVVHERHHYLTMEG